MNAKERDKKIDSIETMTLILVILVMIGLIASLVLATNVVDILKNQEILDEIGINIDVLDGSLYQLNKNFNQTLNNSTLIKDAELRGAIGREIEIQQGIIGSLQRDGYVKINIDSENYIVLVPYQAQDLNSGN